jgi:hypothetical protein
MGQGMGHMANLTPITYNGEVITVTGALLTFETDDGETVETILGPSWYWIDNRIPLASGDQIAFTGFDMPEYYLVTGSIENITQGVTYQARTPDGTPLWRGQGMNRQP